MFGELSYRQILIIKQRGVVHEGIRLSFGVPGRLPRVAPKQDLTYAGYKLPAGVSVYISWRCSRHAAG